MKRICKRVGRIALIVIAALLALVILVLGGLNIAKFGIYFDYYRIKTDVCKNPGLNDGFACQGICADEASDRFLISGYMIDGSASRIYVTDLENRVHYVNLSQNGEPYTGHTGGIALHGDTVYVANGGHIYRLSLQEIVNASNGAELDIGEGVAVNSAASFAYATDQYIYVGEFHNGKNYVTDHPYDTPDGTYHAIVSRYTHDDLLKPDRVYSIRDQVQGICFTPDGQVVLSTSYGLADSYYYIYRESDAILSEHVLDGAPVYYLSHYETALKGPAMSEGLDWYDGKLLTMAESACDKYIFGKFFFAYYLVTLDIQAL